MKRHQPSEDLLVLEEVQAVLLDAQGMIFQEAPALGSHGQCGACLEANRNASHPREVVV